jgi:long-chain fatty acid transport protein
MGDYARWSSFDNLDVRLSNGAVLPFPQNWKDTYVWYAGTEYKWRRPALFPSWEVAARGGYWYSRTPVPDETFTPAVPDANNHTISVGLGIQCREKSRPFGLCTCHQQDAPARGVKTVGVDVAYQAVLYESRTVSGT